MSGEHLIGTETAAELEATQRRALPWADALSDDDLNGFLADLASAAIHCYYRDPQTPDREVLRLIEEACAEWHVPGQGPRSDAPLMDPEVAAELEALRAERDAYCDRVDTLTAVAKGNKRHVQEMYLALQKAHNDLTGANLSLWEEEQENARIRLALKSAKRGRRWLRISLKFAEASREGWRRSCIKAERERDEALARVAELEAAAEEKRRTGIRSSYSELIAQAEQDRDYEGAAIVAQRLRDREAVWAREDPHDSPLHHEYRIGRDLPEVQP